MVYPRGAVTNGLHAIGRTVDACRRPGSTGDTAPRRGVYLKRPFKNFPVRPFDLAYTLRRTTRLP
jgi:hypothetical protein